MIEMVLDQRQAKDSWNVNQELGKSTCPRDPFDCRKPPLPYLAAGLANKNALNQRYIYPHLTLVVPKVPAIAKST
jgi:hypothetical protein